MSRRTLVAGLALAAALLSSGGEAFAQPAVVNITVDEAGHGLFTSPTLGNAMSTGVLAPDPGPGGLAAALTYNLLGPPSLVAGDVLLLEPGSFSTISDIIRFNPAGTGSSAYPASLVFYSDNVDTHELPSLADTGFPGALYTNNRTISEVLLPGGIHEAIYTPGANDPGFIAGFAVTYTFISSVPEPGPMAPGACATVAGLAGVWLRRKRTPA